MSFLNSHEMIIGFIIAWAVFLVLYTAKLKEQLFAIVEKIQRTKPTKNVAAAKPFTFAKDVFHDQSGVYWIYSSTQKHKCVTNFCAWLTNLYARECNASYYHLINSFEELESSSQKLKDALAKSNLKRNNESQEEEEQEQEQEQGEEDMSRKNHIWIVEPSIDNQDFQRWVDFFNGKLWQEIHRDVNIHLFICTPRFPIDTLLEYETDGMFLLNMNRASELEDLAEVYNDIFPSVDAASEAVKKHCAFIDNDDENELHTRGTALYWPCSPPVIDEASGATRPQLFTVDYN